MSNIKKDFKNYYEDISKIGCGKNLVQFIK